MFTLALIGHLLSRLSKEERRLQDEEKKKEKERKKLEKEREKEKKRKDEIRMKNRAKGIKAFKVGAQHTHIHTHTHILKYVHSRSILLS